MPGMGLAFLTPDSDKRKCGKLPLLKPRLSDVGHPCDAASASIGHFGLRNMEQSCHRVTGRRRATPDTWPRRLAGSKLALEILGNIHEVIKWKLDDTGDGNTSKERH